MRDREAYHRAGRNDPLTPDQLREHPYDFVSLPPKLALPKTAVGHDRFHPGRFTGRLTLVYETTSPLHVGSGVFETAEECGLEGGATPVRGIVRAQGRPVLPGSGWKGAVRARFEAITGSRLGLVDTQSREPAFKVPGALKESEQSSRSHQVRIVDPRVTAAQPLRTIREGDLDQLSPAEALFGAMGYRGRIHPSDGRIEGPPASRPLKVAPLDGPVMHRLAKPDKAHNTGGANITISEVEGRKFYYDGEVVHSRTTASHGAPRETWEFVDFVPAGCTIHLDVHLESVTLGEIGALLLSAGQGDNVGILRFGGYKSVGLGKVRLKEIKPRLGTTTTTRSWRRETSDEVDLARAIEVAKEKMVDADALSELHEVTTRIRP